MPGEQLQFDPALLGRLLCQSKSVHGGSMNGRQIRVIGFVAGIGRLPELFGGKRMNHARFKPGRGEGALGDVVVASGSFDGHKQVSYLVFLDRRAELCDRGVEIGAVVSHDRWRHTDVAVEVG